MAMGHLAEPSFCNRGLLVSLELGKGVSQTYGMTMAIANAAIPCGRRRTAAMIGVSL